MYNLSDFIVKTCISFIITKSYNMNRSKTLKIFVTISFMPLSDANTKIISLCVESLCCIKKICVTVFGSYRDW